MKYKIGDRVGVYSPHPLCGLLEVYVVGLLEGNRYTIQVGLEAVGLKYNTERHTRYSVNETQLFTTEFDNNKNKEETMEKNEVKSYADVKEYLIAKGLYERVLEIDWETYEEDTFSDLFTWSKTEEGHTFWNELNDEMLDLDIYENIKSLVQDYKAKQGKEFIEHLEAQPEEVVEAQPTQKPKQYLCYVQGKALPKHIHKTLEQAKQEAQRLCRKELAKVSVLEVVAEYEAEVLVKEVL